MTQQLAYLAQQHFCAIPKHSQVRTDYRPGDVVADFDQWPEYAQRVHLERGMVKMALAEPLPERKINATEPEPAPQPAFERMNRVMPDRSVTDDVRANPLPGGVFVPVDQQKAIRLTPELENSTEAARRAMLAQMGGMGGVDGVEQALMAAERTRLEADANARGEQRREQMEVMSALASLPEDPALVPSPDEAMVRAKNNVKQHNMSEEAAAIAAGAPKEAPAAILPRTSKAKAKK